MTCLFHQNGKKLLFYFLKIIYDIQTWPPPDAKKYKELLGWTNSNYQQFWQAKKLSTWLLSSGQDFVKNFLDSKHVLKVYFKPSGKNQDFSFSPLPFRHEKGPLNSLLITHSRCATDIDEKGNYINGQYKNCDVRTISGPQIMKSCIFPFNYNGTTFTDCTTMNHDQLWCPTKVDEEKNTIEEQWGNCIYSG